MLVLSRKTNQSIQIAENIQITILKIHGDRVRIGVDAPQDIRILRSELTANNGAETE